MHFVCQTQVKEINPTDIVKARESDFADQTTDDNPFPQENLLFLSKVKRGKRQKEDGYLELPLEVLCRFRKGPIAIMCDIEKMLQHFHVTKEHQNYLRFLW